MSKKKLFISCPMKGRTEEKIRNSMDRMHKIAEIMFDQELEVIPSYIPGNAPDACIRPVWYLGESIKKMSEADYFIGVCYTEYFKGCNAEAQIARSYGIRSYFVDMHMFMPDAAEIERNQCQATACCNG